MIHDLSATLQAILDDASLARTCPDLLDADISFKRPDDSFKPTKSTINLFLFNIRENMELRSNEPVIERRNGMASISRAPIRVACTYLVTAWPVTQTEPELLEHRLLGQVLQTLSQYYQIPDSFLQGGLKEQHPPLPMVATHPFEMKSPTEFWTAIGNKMRASLTVTITISMPVSEPGHAHITKTSMVKFGVRAAAPATGLIPATQMEFYRIGGRVRDAAGEVVAGASVTVEGRGLAARTDANGDYVLGAMEAGTYTLNVQSKETVKQVNITVPVPVPPPRPSVGGLFTSRGAIDAISNEIYNELNNYDVQLL